ncbi:hypothetical protein NMY22_g19313 [Coprinellus aureogranulatus]|nr:hypothetical protein NMY22_g19313 [Coprinellus aureogranulatus]
MTASQHRDTQAVIDEKVSRLQTEVNQEVARLQAQANEEVSRLQSQIHHIRAKVNANVSGLETLFGEERSRLNAQRNGLSPINRLPPEILTEILFSGLNTSQECKPHSLNHPGARIHNIPGQNLSGRHYRFTLWEERPGILLFCHICQYWRSVALSSPSLWSHIQVGQGMSPKLLEFIKANVKNVPLTLDVRCQSYAYWNRTREALSSLLHTTLGQLKSLAICCAEPSLAQLGPQALENGTSADLLESLQLIVDSGVGCEFNLLPAGTPNLKFLEVRGRVIPWDSPILRSPQLTHLTLHHIPNLNATTMVDLLALFRHATQLISLYLDLPLQRTVTWEDVGGQPGTPVVLPNLERFHLISKYYAPLAIVMKTLQFNDILEMDLKVLCSETTLSLEPICDFFHPGRPPQQVEIGYRQEGSMKGYMVSCDSPSFRFVGPEGRMVCDLKEEPWITVNTGAAFPFPSLSSTQFRVPWSLSRLLVFVVHDVAAHLLPQAFWEELSELHKLQVVYIQSARICVVRRVLQAMLTVRMRPRPLQPPTATSTAPRLEESKKGPVSHPFPALCCLVLSSLGRCAQDCHRDLQDAGYRITESGKKLSSTALYIRWVTSTLRHWRDYGRRYMGHLSFQAEEGVLEEGDPDHEPKAMFKTVDDVTMSLLKAVAVRVMLGSELVWDRYAQGN